MAGAWLGMRRRTGGGGGDAPVGCARRPLRGAVAPADAAGGGGSDRAAEADGVGVDARSSAVHYEPTDAQGAVRARRGSVSGITDRLEWADLLGLRFAILDDRPAGRPRADAVFARAARGPDGASATRRLEGMIVLPVASLGRCSSTSRIAGRCRWAPTGRRSGSEQPSAFVFASTPRLQPARSAYSARQLVDVTAARGTVTRQLESARRRARRRPGGRPDQRLRRPDVRLGVAQRQRRGVRQRAPAGTWLTVSLGARRRRPPPPGRPLPTTFPTERRSNPPPSHLGFDCRARRDFYWWIAPRGRRWCAC